MTSSTLPATLRLSAAIGDSPLSAAFFELVLPMVRKNSYRLPVGPADECGRLVLSRDEIEDTIHRINDLFPMDYLGLQAGWSGEVHVQPVNRSGVQRLRNAIATWGHTGIYSAALVEGLVTLDRFLAAVEPSALIRVTSSAEPVDAASISVTELQAGG